jgi:ATP-binding cassette subfamily B protein
LRRERLHLVKDQGLAELGASTLALLVMGASMVWMIGQALEGQASLGDLALFYQAFNQGQRLMRSLLESVGQIYYNILFMGNLFDFLNLAPRISDPLCPLPLPQKAGAGLSLGFRQVTFRYPGSDRLALQDLTLTIPAGQVAAIVGVNGAGKSTLAKLLCRLYDPEAGQIEFDGVDLRRLPLREVRQQVTVLFQQPVHYNASVAENIALGHLGAQPSAGEIEAAAQAAGADEPIGRLPQGYETLLGKWFAGGTELSVGEWQRLALARAFLRQAHLIILDEPTSAMDSWAENEWLARFRTLVNGRTALIITHRFTTAMRADIIYVMQAGQMVEAGGHAELLAQGGLYARSWRAQMQVKAGPAEALPLKLGQNGRIAT